MNNIIDLNQGIQNQSTGASYQGNEVYQSGQQFTCNQQTMGNIWYSYPYTYYYPQSTYVYHTPDLTIRKVQNGWIVTKGGKEIVVIAKEDLLQYID